MDSFGVDHIATKISPGNCAGRPESSALRNKLFPDGVAGLSKREATRVFHANKLYGNTCEIFAYCCKNGLPASVENPARSWMWETTFGGSLRTTLLSPLHVWVESEKWTNFVHSFAQMKQVSALCDDRHTHLPWGFNEAVRVWNSLVFSSLWKG